MNSIIKTFINSEFGIESIVSKHEKGFAVSLKDLDANEYLDTVFIFTKIEKAINKAKEYVK